MWAERFGSYSIAATFAGTPSLRRLKSILRYLRLAPPPRWREVTRPYELRPPDFFSPSVSDFSGSVFVTASCWRNVAKRRPGEVGLYFLIAIYSIPWPSKSSIASSGWSVTTAFFHLRRVPLERPRRFGLGLTQAVRTPSTRTPKISSIAVRTCVLFAPSWTRNVYLLAASSA